MNTRILVTGSEHPAGLAAVRALRRAGFEPWAAIRSRRSLGGRSRAAAGYVDVPDARSAPEEFVATLAAAAGRLGVAAVLPGTEAALLAMTGREDAFPDSVAVGTPTEAALRRATSKVALALLALRAGFDNPPIQVLSPELLATSDQPVPAIVKPLRSELTEDGVLHRYETCRVETGAELEAALRALPDEAGLVQPCIDGPLISVNGVAFEGVLHAANQHVVHRVWPERCGQAVFAETIPMDPERERRTAAFMEALGWSGIFNLQLIEHEGRDCVIDLNPRFYVSLTLAVAAGLNLPAIWTTLLLGRSFDERGYRAGVRFRHETGDARAILAGLRRGQLEARDLLPRRRTAHALFSIRDPRPASSILVGARSALRR